MSSRSRGAWIAAALSVLVTTGCSTSHPVVRGASPDVPRAITAGPSAAEHLTGVPGGAITCRGPVVGETRAAPYDGEDTGATPEAALDAARRWSRFDGAQDGYVLARSEGPRRLYVFTVDGVAKQALIVRHGPSLKGDGTHAVVDRWWLESWARCDWAELPDAVANTAGKQIWTDHHGTRQPTSAIVSLPFTGDCFPGMTALDLGGPSEVGGADAKRVPVEYVREPPAELQGEYFDRPYLARTRVPADAVDSGFERDGDGLWLSSDRGYAYVGSRAAAEAWPRASTPVRCA